MEKVVLQEYLKTDFAENKNVAKEIRENILLPTLRKDGAVTFDFSGITGATQSFIHALISDAIRKYPEVFFDNVFFKNVNDETKQIISIVFNYMQQSS